MNYNMYTNRLSDNIDPNYIYPQPYIDPLMYMNPYFINNQNTIIQNQSKSFDLVNQGFTFLSFLCVIYFLYILFKNFRKK